MGECRSRLLLHCLSSSRVRAGRWRIGKPREVAIVSSELLSLWRTTDQLSLSDQADRPPDQLPIGNHCSASPAPVECLFPGPICAYIKITSKSSVPHCKHNINTLVWLRICVPVFLQSRLSFLWNGMYNYYSTYQTRYDVDATNIYVVKVSLVKRTLEP